MNDYDPSFKFEIGDEVVLLRSGNSEWRYGEPEIAVPGSVWEVFSRRAAPGWTTQYPGIPHYLLQNSEGIDRIGYYILETDLELHPQITDEDVEAAIESIKAAVKDGR